jgi:hypothetical protein
MKSKAAQDAPELVELKQRTTRLLRAAVSDPEAWARAGMSAALAERRLNWARRLDEALSDIHQVTLLSAIGFVIRWCYSSGPCGPVPLEALDDPAADLFLPVRVLTQDGAFNFEARFNSAGPHGQHLLHMADQSAATVYSELKQRFCVPGQRELWMRDLDGLREAKHYTNDLHVAFELSLAEQQGRTDAEAYAEAGVTTPTGDRIKKRLGLAKPRKKR